MQSYVLHQDCGIHHQHDMHMQLTSSTFATTGSETSPESVGMLIGATFASLGAGIAAGNCQAVNDATTISTFQTPVHLQGYSYCLWLGVICCLSGETLL